MNISEPVPRILDIDRTLPPGLEQVIQKVLAKESEERYQTAGELVQDYVNAISETDDITLVPPPPATTLTPPTLSEPEIKPTPKPDEVDEDKKEETPQANSL